MNPSIQQPFLRQRKSFNNFMTSTSKIMPVLFKVLGSKGVGFYPAEEFEYFSYLHLRKNHIKQV